MSCRLVTSRRPRPAGRAQRCGPRHPARSGVGRRSNCVRTPFPTPLRLPNRPIHTADTSVSWVLQIRAGRQRRSSAGPRRRLPEVPVVAVDGRRTTRDTAAPLVRRLHSSHYGTARTLRRRVTAGKGSLGNTLLPCRQGPPCSRYAFTRRPIQQRDDGRATRGGQRHRQRVIEAAIQCILEQGFYRASSNAIAERAA